MAKTRMITLSEFLTRNIPPRSLRVVAGELGISASYLSELASGRRDAAVISARLLLNIARYFDVSPMEVLRMAGLIADQADDRAEMVERVAERIGADQDLQEILEIYLASKPAGRRQLRDVARALGHGDK